MAHSTLTKLLTINMSSCSSDSSTTRKREKILRTWTGSKTITEIFSKKYLAPSQTPRIWETSSESMLSSSSGGVLAASLLLALTRRSLLMLRTQKKHLLLNREKSTSSILRRLHHQVLHFIEQNILKVKINVNLNHFKFYKFCVHEKLTYRQKIVGDMCKF